MYGTKEYTALFKQVYEDTGQHHKARIDKPLLRSDCLEFHEAFRHLSSARPWSQIGPGPIQISEILAYLELKGIRDPDLKTRYLRHVRRMDEVELKYLVKKTSK